MPWMPQTSPMSSDDENEYQDDFKPIVTYADSLQDQPDDSSNV